MPINKKNSEEKEVEPWIRKATYCVLAAFCLVLVVLIAYIINLTTYFIFGKALFGVFSDTVDTVTIAGLIASIFVSIVAAIALQNIFHEVGHVIGGLATGYKFFAFSVYNLVLVQTDKGLRWRKYYTNRSCASCHMLLDKDIDPDATPYFWFLAGGAIINVLISMICIIVGKNTEMGIVALPFFSLMALFGIARALCSLIPYTVAGITSDGRFILMLRRSPKNRRSYLHSSLIASGYIHGTSIKDMPRKWFSSELPTGGNDHLGIISYLDYIALLEAEERWDDARIAFEQLDNITVELPSIYSLELARDHVIAELLSLKRRNIVKKLWTKRVEEYTIKRRKYSPSKLAALYAIELLYYKDEKKAMQFYEELERKRDCFYVQAETASALELVKRIAKTQPVADEDDSDETPHKKQ